MDVSSLNITLISGMDGGSISITLLSIIKAVAILVLGVILARIVKAEVIKASRNTTYVWIINEESASALYNLIVFIAVIESLNALGILSYKLWGVTLSNLLIALLIFYFSYLLAKKSKDYLISRAPQSKLPEVQLKAKLFYYTVITLAFFIALNIAGISGELSTLLAAAGITGIVLGFASQAVISNFISGIFMYFDKPLQVGDAVRLPESGVEGIVEDIHILSTRIRQWDGTLIRIPNASLFNSSIVNLQRYPVRRTTIVVGISYKSDIRKAIDTVLRVLDEEPYVLAKPEPKVYVEELGDSSVNLTIWAWVPSSLWIGQNLLRSRFHLLQKIKEALEAEGIEIPFPQRVNWFAEELKVRIEK
ncbi:mechanosensitive ion channel family protein [Thermococcus sp.]|uniref:mechanosensitive ion channel family protein n=1 Tax=Thermococcus sp. TaxID=35749 RepID=UPI00261809CB|nr:mechanosensitive ion channel family protein [Thermococcus sp.]